MSTFCSMSPGGYRRQNSLDEILEALVEMTSLALNCDRCSFFLNDAGTGELYSRVAQGIRRREIRLLNNDGVIGAAFQTGRSIIIDDAYVDPRFNPTIDRETGYVTKTVLCVPLCASKSDIIGVAQALKKAGGVFTEHDQALLEGIAAQSIPALRSSQTVERMQKARAQELAFLDIIADITSQIDLDQLLQRVMTEATRMLGAERSTLFLHDEKTKELFSRVAMGPKIDEIRFPDHAGIAGTVFTTGKTVNIPHAYADLRFNTSFDKQTGFFTRSILCTPLINKHGLIIGVTQALNKSGGPFSAEDESRLKAFTAQVAIALENAKLFDDVQKIKNYNESMLESMSNGVITLDDREIIVTCNSAGARIIRLAPSAILGHSAAEFFAGKNAWIIERIKKVQVEKAANVAMDVEIAFGDRPVSVNLTVLPLASGDGKQLGTLHHDRGHQHREARQGHYGALHGSGDCRAHARQQRRRWPTRRRQHAGDRPILRYSGLHHIERGAWRARHGRLPKRIFLYDGRVHRSRGRYARQVYRRRYHGGLRPPDSS